MVYCNMCTFMWSLKGLSIFSHNGPTRKFAFDFETGNTEGQCQRQGPQWIVLITFVHTLLISLRDLSPMQFSRDGPEGSMCSWTKLLMQTDGRVDDRTDGHHHFIGQKLLIGLCWHQGHQCFIYMSCLLHHDFFQLFRGMRVKVKNSMCFRMVDCITV